MNDPDAEAFEYYDDPAHLEPAPGRPRRRPKRPLTRHVPVRFPAETIDAVQTLAESDGMTVSSWIRRAVDDELHRRGEALTPEHPTTDAPLDVVDHVRRLLDELAAKLEQAPARRAQSGRR